MSLIVEVYVNQTLIARAVARNQSNLADISDYIVDARLEESKFSPKQKLTGLRINGHNRSSPVWSLIEKMMKVIQNPGYRYFEFKGMQYRAKNTPRGTSVERVA